MILCGSSAEEERSMRRFAIPLALLVVLAIPSLATARSGTTFRAQLHEMNGSGVNGTIWVTQSGNTLTVTLEATGLEPAQDHLRHIHGQGDGVSNAGASGVQMSKCPTPAADANDNGLVEFEEGPSDYGGVAQDLGTFSTSTGAVSLTTTITGVELSDLLPLDRRAAVVHGLTVAGTYDLTLPVACGQLHAQG
jgi:Cu/Zn superoxide dismutase